MKDYIISKADNGDVQNLVRLVNSAYRGEEAKKGWTHEADLIEGSFRTDEKSLTELINQPGSVILKLEIKDELKGCVFLEQQADKIYLGMLSVSPNAQAQGIGKKLLNAAEEYAHQLNCKSIEMTVISVRSELLDWYQRHGYSTTGKTKPFHDDARFGTPKKPIEFIVLEKKLKIFS